MIRVLFIIAVLGLMGFSVEAREFRSITNIDTQHSTITDENNGAVMLQITLTKAVPWRLGLRDEPHRFLIDLQDLEWHERDIQKIDHSDRVLRIRSGHAEARWSRLSLELDGPYRINRAGMSTDQITGVATIEIELYPTTQESFAKNLPLTPQTWPTATRASDITDQQNRTRQIGDRPLRVVLDPGHGGWDSGAERGGVREADLVLRFAQELKETLLRRGGFEVVMTRQSDRFVPLSERISIARRAQADVFLSLHADALEFGTATGATVYTLSETPSDAVSAQLAEMHAREDLILGLNLDVEDDEITAILTELARQDVAPRSQTLAQALVEGLGRGTDRLYKKPHLQADFVVLKAPDIPSVLIELGFMSNPQDLARLQDREWRAEAVMGITWALENWRVSDATEALLLRH